MAAGGEVGRRGANVAAKMVKRTRASASAEEKSEPFVGAEGVAEASASRARAAGAQAAACAAASVGGVADLRTMRRSESR
eukprot:1215230-Pleurochrysis_carterae.AAC.1